MEKGMLKSNLIVVTSQPKELEDRVRVLLGSKSGAYKAEPIVIEGRTGQLISFGEGGNQRYWPSTTPEHISKLLVSLRDHEFVYDKPLVLGAEKGFEVREVLGQKAAIVLPARAIPFPPRHGAEMHPVGQPGM